MNPFDILICSALVTILTLSGIYIDKKYFALLVGFLLMIYFILGVSNATKKLYP